MINTPLYGVQNLQKTRFSATTVHIEGLKAGGQIKINQPNAQVNIGTVVQVNNGTKRENITTQSGFNYMLIEGKDNAVKVIVQKDQTLYLFEDGTCTLPTDGRIKTYAEFITQYPDALKIEPIDGMNSGPWNTEEVSRALQLLA